MEERKGDARIYVISCFFFTCIVTGGVLLGLYIFDPKTHSGSWYAITGMVLVGIPWLFWFIAYVYRCFFPNHNAQIQQQRYISASNHASTRTPPVNSASPRSGVTTTATTMNNSYDVESPASDGGIGYDYSPNDGRRHVHFGGVVVMGDEVCNDSNNNSNNNNSNRNSENDCGQNIGEVRTCPAGRRESEVPLNFSAE